jgi:hypothetical protein
MRHSGLTEVHLIVNDSGQYMQPSQIDRSGARWDRSIPDTLDATIANQDVVYADYAFVYDCSVYEQQRIQGLPSAK